MGIFIITKYPQTRSVVVESTGTSIYWQRKYDNADVSILNSRVYVHSMDETSETFISAPLDRSFIVYERGKPK